MHLICCLWSKRECALAVILAHPILVVGFELGRVSDHGRLAQHGPAHQARDLLMIRGHGDR